MDEFREWLSDNLRYFMLGGAILIIVIILFFGIRAFVNKGGRNEETVEQKITEDTKGNAPSSPENDGETDDGKEETDPMVMNDADMVALMIQYYEALGEKNVTGLKKIVNDLSPSDEAKILNAKDYIERYEVGDVYQMPGIREDTFVVYTCFYYICRNIQTPVPAMSQFYVTKDTLGDLKINGVPDKDTEIYAFMEESAQDPAVKKISDEVQKAYDEAREKDADLAAYLDGFGEEAQSTADGNISVRAIGECNVRDRASEDGDILGILSEGDEVVKKGTDGEWTVIDYNGITGYVFSELLEN